MTVDYRIEFVRSLCQASQDLVLAVFPDSRSDAVSARSPRVPINPACDYRAVIQVSGDNGALELRAFVFVERSERGPLSQLKDLTNDESIAASRAGVAAKIVQPAGDAPGAQELRFLRKQAREPIVRAAPESAVDEDAIGSQLRSNRERMFQLARVQLDLSGLHGDQRLLDVLTAFDHVLEMQRSELEAPGIGERMADFRAYSEQRRMRQRDHAFFQRLAFGADTELHVHSVGMADGDAGLEPAEIHLPGAAEGIRAGLEVAKVLDHSRRL